MSFNVAHARIARERTGERSHAGLAETACYWFAQAGIYLVFGLLFYYSAHSKLIDNSGEMPSALAHSYEGTWIASFPGTNTSWLLLGILEAIVFVAIAVSALTGEFLPTRKKPFLLVGMGLAMLTFAILSWGQNITGEHESVAQLFGYLVGTAVLIVFVLLMPPYRNMNWLSGLTSQSEDREE